MNPNQVELNSEFKKALDILENSQRHVFITGKAGTGKSTLLEYFRHTTHKKIAVLAPTGVAALNVKGETIHSFFGFKPDITLEKIKRINKNRKQSFNKIDMIIIDEVSMVRADLFDCIARYLQINGKNSRDIFGDIQMVFIGDLYQLPPVVTAKEKTLFSVGYKSPYFFDSYTFPRISLEFIELEKIYRQKDDIFIQLLNSIRNNSITQDELDHLNQRVGARFGKIRSKYHINLTTTNDVAYRINNDYLKKLGTELHSYTAGVQGKFDKKYYPTDFNLTIKKDAQVMLLNNDSEGRWVNGSIGKIIDISPKNINDNPQDIIIVELSNGDLVEVEPHTWEIFHYQFDTDTKTLETETVGTFTQYPVKLAWAVTIHKSQGKTFDKVIIDLSRGTFAHGQMYVALSRCTSMEGIILKQPIKKGHVFMDWRVVNFLTKYQYAISNKNCPIEDKLDIIKRAIQNKKMLEIVYLKTNDTKSRRIIYPLDVGNKTYLNKMFLGMNALCYKRNQERVFRIDRILNIRELHKQENSSQGFTNIKKKTILSSL